MHDDETRPVRAVQRRKPRPAMLHDETATSSSITCIENMTWSALFGVGSDSYHFEPGGLVATAPWALFFKGWHYEFHDPSGALRFSMRRGLRLLFHRLRIFGDDGRLIAKLEQRPSMMALHFDVFDDEGNLRLELTQPANTFTRFHVLKDGREVAQIEREYRKWKDAWKHRLSVRDAFNIVGIDPSLDEFDRLLIIAASLFFDRLYFTDERE